MFDSQTIQAIFTATPGPKPTVGNEEWEQLVQDACDFLFAEESPPSEAYQALQKKLAESTTKIKFDAEGCFSVG